MVLLWSTRFEASYLFPNSLVGIKPLVVSLHLLAASIPSDAIRLQIVPRILEQIMERYLWISNDMICLQLDWEFDSKLRRERSHGWKSSRRQHNTTSLRAKLWENLQSEKQDKEERLMGKLGGEISLEIMRYNRLSHDVVTLMRIGTFWLHTGSFHHLAWRRLAGHLPRWVPSTLY